ncbi:MAG TPA: alpha/beta hydrolase [Polyangiaceae bacterium]|jgi:dienelactone hydrolase|nr:alpha/beta hydrolase [Polyangiaceae bacterium]
MDGVAVPRANVEFQSGKDTCRAWSYRPANAAGLVPCIVMAHGLGGTREATLAPYAERFRHEGFAVLVFDYRGFGGSGGEPRQVVSAPAQLDDWQAAIDCARALSGVDPSRIGLWGSSFSGGHVVRAAVSDGRVAAVSSQCPMMDGRAALFAVVKSAGPLQALRMTFHGIRDLVQMLIGGAPHTIPLVAAPGNIAAMSTPESEPGYRAISPPDFVNAIAARICVQIGSYRPGLAAAALKCPILIQICEKDSLAPPSAAEAAARRAGARATVKRYPVGHFDVYLGEPFAQSVADQSAFFRQHLLALQ